MTKPRLSICIATYNRAKYIGEMLESVIPQVTDEVEIVIADGASTDGTGNIVKKYTDVCKRVNYIQLPSKGGVDQDFCKAVEHATGEYCWLFSDDDLFKSDAIRTILNELPKNYSLIVVNAQVMSDNFSRIVENKRLRINENEIYLESEMELLFKRVVSYMAFIGSVVIRRDLWMKREKERYYGTEFIHVGVVFQAPLPSPALVIAKPYITIRFGNVQWVSRAIEIWMFKWPNLLSSFSHIPKHVRQKYQMTNPWLKFKKIIVCRGLGGYSLKEYRKWFVSKDSSLYWRFIALLIAIIPTSFVNFFLRTYPKFISYGVNKKN